MDALPDIRQLLAEHAAALAAYESAIDDRSAGKRDADRAVTLARRYMESVSVAIDLAIEQRGAVPADVPSQMLTPVGPVDALKDSDVRANVPDPMQGALHTVKRGRNKRGATAEVKRRGVATVIGSTEWNTDRLREHLDERATDVVAFLASDRLAHVRQLTLGANALDVTRAADAILTELGVDPMTGTDAVSWQSIDTPDRAVPADADAMTAAILAGETLDTLVSLSRHRAGICGGLVPDRDVSSVTAANTTGIRPAQSAWRDHGLDPRQITPRRVTISDLADRTCPTVETAGWPNAGPRSSRPKLPRWRKSERGWTERGEHYTATPGAPVMVPATVTYRDGRPTLVAGQVFSVERIAGRSALWTERVHIGNETVARGPLASGSKSRPTTTVEREAVSAAAAARVAAIRTIEDPTDQDISEAVAALQPGDSVRFAHRGTIASVKRSARGDKYRPRVDGIRLPESRTADRAAEVIAVALT